jgi:hypothetical protein
MVVSLRVLGSMVIDVEGGQLDAVFLDDLGSVRDRFVIRKGNPLAVADAQPSRPAALSAAPNPFPGSTRLSFILEEPASVDLSIIDAEGRRVATLLERAALAAGLHVVPWDGCDSRGRALAAGVYYEVLTIGGDAGGKETRSMVLVR